LPPSVNPALEGGIDSKDEHNGEDYVEKNNEAVEPPLRVDSGIVRPAGAARVDSSACCH
jgi:hypothetical protein